MFRLIRISLWNPLGIFRMCSVKGTLLRSYSHCTSAMLLVMVSSTASSVSPLKL